ncbi:benzoate 1,2-dioxygenase electron transfer component BenC [Xanthomonas sacchari]|uniref:2Fe-2S iron-sulfur cluster binding domain-containing protein n=2 Tax=Xanthomonas TaxID=338 RepID=A0A6N7QBJ0_9XANT|nr:MULTISPECIES: benzoate 1,2-dioxygenase electron transfer component BenC [Xanthomonas]MCC4589778.1 ring-hydroxylating dioxygenase ferredoxin reductase family protein [Xanthomonas campestris pv. cannae]AJC46078.1 NADH oxidase [Xanthomonas sacchari]KAB7771739.1 NADH oxidase [Xanthomonas sp. LMG 12462]KAB7775987.1 NADH oxidase [Xanthomonas sp. LMG 12459]KAB7778915.1 NADH oxidase [Xanthomonas sp. LMG 12460]
MSYRIALNFEDGITRFIDCNDGETVLDAAFRQRINLPMDCADGVCGTCKCRAERGRYDLGEDYIEDALSADEAAAGMVLTCQMRPQSDCAVAVPATSLACKTGSVHFQATVAAVVAHADAALELTLETIGPAPAFLPGQYVNIAVPGSGQLRAYSFSSAPGASTLTFLIRRVPGGLMSAYLDAATPGQVLDLNGPLGSFYLREITRPLLLLAGGTGLAPFLSMLAQLQASGCAHPVHLMYGVTRGADLVLLERLQALAEQADWFTFDTCVVDPAAAHPRTGYVTEHLPAHALHGGDVDVYLCGPPPMVEAVRTHFSGIGLVPAAFHYEKFTPSAVAPVQERAA